MARSSVALVLLLASACGPSWVVERSNDTVGWLGVHAMGGGEAWVVGAAGADGKASILHRTGGAWLPVESGVETVLWWVTASPGGTVWTGGERGVVLRREAGNTAVFSRIESPSPTATVFGIWAAADDDVWLVGGDGTAGAFVWRFDGSVIRVVTGLPEGLADRSTIYKVWGRSPTDVHFVGTDGLSLRFDGTAFTRLATNTNSTLFTVHGDASRVVAVGGALGGALLLEWDGARWNDRSPVVDQLFGVSSMGGLSVAVGQSRTVVESTGGGWDAVDGLDSGAESLHSVSVAPDGVEAFAVGGIVASPPFIKGLVLRRGR